MWGIPPKIEAVPPELQPRLKGAWKGRRKVIKMPFTQWAFPFAIDLMYPVTVTFFENFSFFKKNTRKLEVVAQALIPKLWREKQVGPCEYKVSMFYRVIPFR